MENREKKEKSDLPGKLNTPKSKFIIGRSVFEQVWNQSFDGMRLVNKEGIVVFVNDALCRLFEKSREEIEGNHYTVCYDSDSQDYMLKKQKERFLSHTIEPNFERQAKLWNGKEVWFELSNSFITSDDKEQLLLSIFRDVTNRKATEEKLKEHIISKDKFFSIIAHDLKSPFQGLIGFSNILLEDYENLSEDEIKEFIGNISKSATNLFYLLQNLLEWSRLQTGKMEYVPSRLDLGFEIKMVINILIGNALRKGIKIINEIPEGIFLMADRNMLNSICQNLITNAIKFSNSGGEVKITVSDEGNFVEVTVSDTGVGIREADMEKLFRLDISHSTRGTANEGGTGLGLLLLKDMVELHKGTIRAESHFGKGSRFMFTLPKYKETV